MATKTIGQLTQATTINNVDEFAIEQSGVTKRVAASVVRGDIVNANIKSDAAIAFSKLAPLNSAQILVGNGSNVPTAVSVTGDVTISNAGVTALARPYTLATAQNSTSGTSIDFTGIPSWAKRITVIFDGFSTNGTSNPIVRVGSGSFATTGYNSVSVFTGGANEAGQSTSTSGFHIRGNNAGNTYFGVMSLLSISGNTWISTTHLGILDGYTFTGGGSIALGGVLDRIRITTVNGTDTFDAGTINIAYEG